MAEDAAVRAEPDHRDQDSASRPLGPGLSKRGELPHGRLLMPGWNGASDSNCFFSYVTLTLHPTRCQADTSAERSHNPAPRTR